MKIQPLIVCADTLIQYYADLFSIPVFSVTINIIRHECNFLLLKTFTYSETESKYYIILFFFNLNSQSMIAIWQEARNDPC